MRSIPYFPQLFTVFFVSAAAAAQSPWGFPLGQRFTAVSLNGQSYGEKAPTLSVSQKDGKDAMRGDGFAGCNAWFGQVALGPQQISVGDVGTTRMFCAERMESEQGFLTALKAVKRWRMDGPSLVLEGEQTRLVLSPASAIKP